MKNRVKQSALTVETSWSVSLDGSLVYVYVTKDALFELAKRALRNQSTDRAQEMHGRIFARVIAHATMPVEGQQALWKLGSL